MKRWMLPLMLALVIGWSADAAQAGMWDWLFWGHGKCAPCEGEKDIVRVVWQVVEEPVCIPGCNGACGKVRMVRRVIRSEVRTRVPVLRWEAPAHCPCALPPTEHGGEPQLLAPPVGMPAQ